MRRLIAAVSAGLAVSGLVGCERGELDRQMEVMCKKDGGIKVYETVTLPASYFDETGSLKLGRSMPWGVNKVGIKSHFYRIGEDEYRYIVTVTQVAGRPNADATRGEGLLNRWQTVVLRTSDSRRLGESISFDRGGGDGITFGFQPSGDYCPKPRLDLTQSIFMKGS